MNDCFAVRLTNLRKKEVINVCTCRSLGCISDLEIDTKTGQILSLIVPDPGRLYWFPGREFEYFISWKSVTSIGKDIILVNIDEEACRRKCL